MVLGTGLYWNIQDSDFATSLGERQTYIHLIPYVFEDACSRPCWEYHKKTSERISVSDMSEYGNIIYPPNLSMFCQCFSPFWRVHFRSVRATQLAAIVLFCQVSRIHSVQLFVSRIRIRKCFFIVLFIFVVVALLFLFSWRSDNWQVIRNWFSACVLCFCIVYLGIRSKHFIKCGRLCSALVRKKQEREPKNIENQYMLSVVGLSGMRHVLLWYG